MSLYLVKNVIFESREWLNVGPYFGVVALFILHGHGPGHVYYRVKSNLIWIYWSSRNKAQTKYSMKYVAAVLYQHMYP